MDGETTNSKGYHGLSDNKLKDSVREKEAHHHAPLCGPFFTDLSPGFQTWETPGNLSAYTTIWYPPVIRKYSQVMVAVMSDWIREAGGW